MSGPQSFELDSTRLASSQTNGLVALSAWCPPHDLFALITHDSFLHIHRFNWQKIIALSLAETEVGKQGEEQPEGVCIASCLVWRPDGKALAIGFHSGRVALVSIESKTFVYDWKHSNTEASITTLRWIDYPHPSHPTLQHQYLSAFSNSPQSHASQLLVHSATEPDATTTFFSALPPLDSIHESFALLCTPIGAPVPAIASGGSSHTHSHRSGRNNQSTTHANEPIRSVAHDAYDYGRLSLLLVGDSAGLVRVRACATLEVLEMNFSTGNAQQAILAVDVCPTSGLINILTRSTVTHRIQLHPLFVPAFLTHSHELLHLTQQFQQIEYLNEYITKGLDQVLQKWKPARKSFHNKMISLSDVISEITSESADPNSSSPVEPDTDPASELLDCLITGIPSYFVQQFISRYLSNEPMTKTMTLIATTLDEIHGILFLGLMKAMEELCFRVEDLRASSKWQERFEAIGLQDEMLSQLQEKVGSLYLHTQQLIQTTIDLKHRYASFSPWFISCIRLVNNEHDGLAPRPDATQEEKDSQPIPSYGPFDIETIQKFLETDLETDVFGQRLGELRKNAIISSTNAGVPKRDESMLEIPSYEPPCHSYTSSPSLAASFQAFLTAFDRVVKNSSKVISAAKIEQPFTQAGDSMRLVDLFQAAPLEPIASTNTESGLIPMTNILGTSRSVTLQSVSTNTANQHLLAFLWRDDPSQQFVTVVKCYAIAANEPDVQATKQLTILIPASPTIDAATTNTKSQVMSLEFYDATSLHILVQYSSILTDDAEIPPSLSSKMWLIQLDGVEDDQWCEVTDLTKSTPLTDTISGQVANGACKLFSLLPSDDDTTLHMPSRSRYFPSTCIGDVRLNSHRSLAGVLVSHRKVNTAPQPRIGGDDEDDEDEEKRAPSQQQLLVQQIYKPTRKVILLIMDEDEEGEEEVEEEVTEVEDGAGEAVPDSLLSDLHQPMDESASPMTSKPASARSSLGPTTPASASKRNLSFSSPMVPILITLIFILTLGSFDSVAGSAGDVDHRFRHCLDVCSSRCVLLENAVRNGYDENGQPHPIGSDPFTVLTQEQRSRLWSENDLTGIVIDPKPLSWYERTLFGWTCGHNCAYHCMHSNVALRETRGEPVVKYYGKWPFVRVLGTQELFSSLFSIVNALPHIYWLFRLRQEFGEAEFSMKSLWYTYSLVYCNTWLWSTVFHARDFVWSERLDYFCASAGISFSLCIAIIRIWRIDAWMKRILYVFLPVGSLLVTHIGYLQLIHFDYGWNMKVSITVGAIHSLLWCYNCYLHWSDGYHWRMLVVTLGLWCFASLEIFDFPPFWSLLDAHAIWHGLTPVLGYLFYTWVREDILHQLKELEEAKHKHV